MKFIIDENKIQEYSNLTHMYGRKHRIMKIDIKRKGRYDYNPEKIANCPTWIFKTKFSLASNHSDVEEFFPIKGKPSNIFSEKYKKSGKM